MNEAHLIDEDAGYLWGLYYYGVRKSELYERVAEDCRIILQTGQALKFPLKEALSSLANTQFFFSLDFHARKKHGAEVPPLELPLDWPGVPLLVKLAQKASERNKITKTVFTYEVHEGGKTRRIQKTGELKPIKTRTAKLQKSHYLFPNIQSTKAWDLVKQILGEKYYPHFLRLNRITDLCSDPTTSISRLKSYTGIRSIDALDFYLGVSKKEQRAATDFMDKQIRKQQPETQT
jgi:hypothetical protein